MEGMELGTVVLVSSLVMGAIALPMTAVAIHQRRRRSFEKKAAVRRKEKIQL